MEETVVRPSIFVVDGQIDIPFRRLGCSRRRQPCSAAQLGLGLMLLLVVAGLAVQGWFLLQLHWRLEAVGTPLQDKGAKPWEQLLQERKPQQAKTVALLTGANFSWTGSGGPVLSETKLGLAFLRGLSYRDRALVVAQAGYCYIYSKVQLGGKSCSQGLTGDCLPITHVLYRHMPCFPEEVELLVSQWSPGRQAGSSQVWWDSSFLGGVVHLNMGEEVVVRILSEHVIRLHDGTRSYFRAFMV